MKLIPIAFLILTTASCRHAADEKHSRPVARVADAFLYEEELQQLIPQGLKGTDTAAIRQNYIRSWVKEQLVYQKAINTLSQDEKNKDEQVENYYQSLIRYDFEQKMLNQRPMGEVSEEDIAAYYSANEKNFELKRNIVRLLYLKLPLQTAGIKEVSQWMRNPDSLNLRKLSDYAVTYAANYSLDTSSWFYFDDITKEIPISEAYSQGHFIRNNSYVELRDSSNVYLVNILDSRIKDDVAPLALVKNRIITILLNRRKVNMLKELENEIYREGLRDKLFEIY